MTRTNRQKRIRAEIRDRCELDGKVNYTFDTAVHRALVLSKKVGRGYRVYECELGGTYHLTKRKKKI